VRGAGRPFAREYGGLLDTRSFGGVQVSRTFYARGQTGQQLLLGAYQALEEQVAAGTVKMHTRSEMLDLVLVNGKARGIITRNLVTGAIESTPPTSWSSRPEAMAMFSISPPTRKAQTPPPSGGLTGAAPCLASMLHTDSSDVHPRQQRASVEANVNVRIPPE